MERSSKIYIAGHRGMAGSSIERKLREEGYNNIVTRTSSELDLRNQQAVKEFFENEKPEYVILAAAKVGGINANVSYPVDFLYDNLMIQNNVIKFAYNNFAKKIIFLGSSCIYPRNSIQPLKEEYVLQGELEPTNEGYALAKIAGIKLLEAYSRQFNSEYIVINPCNLYGFNDSFDLKHSHVLSALVKKFVDAATDSKIKEVVIWGSGIARREFMNVDDLADSVLFYMSANEKINFINIGPGVDISIKELAETISDKVGYKGKIIFDKNKPDGMLRKCLDVTKMKNSGFHPKIGLSEGINQVINLYKNTQL
jgi:GDP-L-fucose synthase